MLNIESKVNGDTLTLTIDLSKEFGRSKSGKTVIIASTQGNKKIDGTEAVIGVNCYKK